MNPLPEKRAISSIALIFAFRMLGLFMILPVFSLYAHNLQGATPMLIGVALGIYGLTQGLLQIPFGLSSDKIGRKPIITLGLLLFALGSVIAAMSHTIWGVIIGRALQGGGAVGSTLIALIADLTSEETRTKAMAMLGMTIGTSFILAMVLGPLLNSWIHVSGIFWITALLAVAGIVILHRLVPNPKKLVFHSDSEAVPALFKSVLRQTELLRLDLGIFLQHAILTATFIVIPVALQQNAGLASGEQWFIYLPVLVLSFLTMIPFIIIAEKKRKMKPVFVSAIALTCIAQLLLANFHSAAWSVALILFAYFTAFNLLEASLPSLVSKIAPIGSKGTAMGVYSSSQFLGIFFGGTLGGWLYGQHQISSVFYACAIMALVWLLVAYTMRKPAHLSTHMLSVGDVSQEQAERLNNALKAVRGVQDVAVSSIEGIAYLKIDKLLFDEEKAKALIQS